MAKIKLTEEDIALFRSEMSKVKPFHRNTKVSLKHLPKKQPLNTPTFDESESFDFPFSDTEKLEPVSTDDVLSFHQPGVQHKTLRKLRLGQYNVEAILDLHGKTVPEARKALGNFILQCKSQGIRYGLIIHGKGQMAKKPVLKNKLNHWLREIEDILAFCSASKKQGSTGAVYILLKGKEK